MGSPSAEPDAIPRPASTTGPRAPRAVPSVVLLAAVIAGAEALIMLVLPSITSGWSQFASAALDAALLVLLTSPALLLFVVRPLHAELVARRRLEETLRAAAAELEARVADRTAALEVANRRLQVGVERLERHGRTLEVLLQTSETLHGCVEAQECYEALARCMHRLDPASKGALFVHREAGDALARVVTWGEHYDAPQRFLPGACRVMCGGRAGRSTDDPCGGACAHGCGSAEPAVCVPLVAQGEDLGLLHVVPGGPPMPEGAGDDDVLLLAAGTLSLALANLRLRESLVRQVARDPLTGLYNRRHMEESIVRELSRAEREEGDVSVLLLDLDHFKRVNDAHGHPAGDAVLREVGGLLARFFRAEDIVCRFGGEEFCVVLPGMPKTLATRRAEALRRAIGALETDLPEGGLGRVTASIGVATFPADALDADDLLRVADRAMYEAKRDGRDRVAVVSVRAAVPGAGTG